MDGLRGCGGRRYRVVAFAVSGSALAALAVGWTVWWYGYLTDPVIWRAGAVLIAVASFMAAVGLDASIKLAPAILACVFLIPVDPTGHYHIAQPLETATAFAAQRACDLFGMNVDRSGNLLSINGVDVTIAEACNGIRMVLTLFMVCYVVAFTLPLKSSRSISSSGSQPARGSREQCRSTGADSLDVRSCLPGNCREVPRRGRVGDDGARVHRTDGHCHAVAGRN